MVRVRALPEHRVEVESEDGVAGVIDYRHVLRGAVSEPLRDPARWAEAGCDEEGVVC